MADAWNHNVHYDPVILKAVPSGCRQVLDVGCGTGRLTRELGVRCESVTGIDRDEAMIAFARELAEGATFIRDDFLTYEFEPESFDFVGANTSLHHMDFAAALRKLVHILRPGGRLAVIGLGRDASPADWAMAVAAMPADRLLKLRHGYYACRHRCASDPQMPIRDPALSWAQTRAIAREVLPGARYRRLLLWRYSLIWDKPGG